MAECTVLERRHAERHREFESRPLRLRPAILRDFGGHSPLWLKRKSYENRTRANH